MKGEAAEHILDFHPQFIFCTTIVRACLGENTFSFRFLCLATAVLSTSTSNFLHNKFWHLDDIICQYKFLPSSSVCDGLLNTIVKSKLLW